MNWTLSDEQADKAYALYRLMRLWRSRRRARRTKTTILLPATPVSIPTHCECGTNPHPLQNACDYCRMMG